MRFFALLLVYALFLAPAARAEPVTTRAWQEAVVSVHDLEQSAQFFREIGGYETKWQGPLDPSEIRGFGLPPTASGEGLLLGPADATSGLLRLVRFDNAGKRKPMRPGSRAWDTGCYFSLMVRIKDMASVYDDAIEMGWWTETPITYLEFGESMLNVVIFRGPGGLQVQGYERLSPALPEAVGEFERMTRPFNVMQMVRDRDASYAFFTEGLGFATFYNGKPYVADEPEFMPLGIPYNLTPSIRYRAGIVYPEPGEFGRMEMIEIMDLDGHDYADRCRAPNLGILAIRFEVADASNAQAVLRERNLRASTLQSLVLEPYGDFTMFDVMTPDGALIQFLAGD